MDYLRARETEETSHKHRRSSSQTKQSKRSSLHSLTSGTKNIVKGRFGDAFKMFESNSSSGPERGRSDSGPRTPTEPTMDMRPAVLTPIAGSEAAGPPSDDDRPLDEEQDLPPEVRRELERRRLSAEERRVEAAAQEYRQRIASDGAGKGKPGPTRASTIQNRVKNLLDESQKQAPASRTAEGYGKYTDTGKPLPSRPGEPSGSSSGSARPPPTVARKPLAISQNTPADPLSYPKPRAAPGPSLSPAPSSLPPMQTSASAPLPTATRVPTGSSGAPRPPPPSKPTKLRTGGANDFSAPLSSSSRQNSPVKSSSREKPLPPVVGSSSLAGQQQQQHAGEEWDVDSFSKRYPSLNRLEMVEREIPGRGGGGGGVRDV